MASPSAAGGRARAATRRPFRRRGAERRTGPVGRGDGARRCETSAGPTTPACDRWLVVVVDRPLDARARPPCEPRRDTGVVVLGTAGIGRGACRCPSTRCCDWPGRPGTWPCCSRTGLPDRAGVRLDRLDPADSRRARPRPGRPRAGRRPRTTLPGPRPAARPARHRARPRCHRPARTGPGPRGRDRLVATLGRTGGRPGPGRPLPGGSARPRRGHHRLGEVRAAADAHRRPGAAAPAGPVLLPAGRLQGRRGLRRGCRPCRTRSAWSPTWTARRRPAPCGPSRAELTRRERILAAHGVVDIAALPDDVALARLVIVVDEFATLAEELPAFVPGLVAIAQRGRSLGVHLVLATQRPSGVVSPEIRANCTLRICLRTTDEADSRDVLGTTARGAPAGRPARPRLPAVRQRHAASRCRSRGWPAGRGSAAPPAPARCAAARGRPAPAPPPSGARPDRDAPIWRRLCRAARPRTRSARASRVPHRPWRPPLPDRVEVADLRTCRPTGDRDATARQRSRLPIGLIDRPDIQSREPLELDLAEGGTWLVVGGPRSGRTTLLRTVLGEAVHRLRPRRAARPRHRVRRRVARRRRARPCRTRAPAVGGEDAFRTVRLVDRLGREVAARRAATGPTGSPRSCCSSTGIEALSALLDDADPARGSAALLRLLRDGAAVGLTCVVTADRAVPGGRLAAVARQRIVLPLPDRADYAVAGVAGPRRPGRCGRPGGPRRRGVRCECQLRPPPRAWRRRNARGVPFPPPIRIVELPPDPRCRCRRAARRSPAGGEIARCCRRPRRRRGRAAGRRPAAHRRPAGLRAARAAAARPPWTPSPST